MKIFGHMPFSQSTAFTSLMVIAGMLAAAGCSKSNAPALSSQAATQAQTNPAAASNGQPDLAELQRSLIRWIVGNRRMPANFEDFAATAGVKIPPPPPGQKYIITSNMHIQLVSK
ncbi:MAG TPA: hypothetical protein VGI03_04135 [Verrucomicrobiae bacterium]